jgi:glycosyltransferase involved in cell wall biosynthesis
MRKLDILIPQYQETDQDLKNMLDSIAIQQNVDLKNDIGVIIVNDGSDVFLSDELLNSYEYPIEYYKNEHKGVSATRNACLDHSKADYVMFCDADDMFFNACGLWIIFNEMKGEGFDSLVSVFIEETRIPETKEVTYITREMDSTFVHGKVHRRQYLIDENIRWNDDLTIHEDSYFNIQCQRLSSKVKYCQSPFYLWKWRDNSVCRHDEKYILKTFNNMIDSMDACATQFIKRNKVSIAKQLITSIIFDCYFTMNKKEWLEQENQEYRLSTEKRFKQFYEKYKEYYETIDEREKNSIIVGIKNRMFREGMMLESMTFNDWIQEIEKL